MPNQTDLSLSPGQIPTTSASINLSIPFATFGAVPFEECEAALDAAGLHEPIYNLVLYRLFGFLDWSKTIRIGEHDFMLGWTGVFSEDALASKINCCGKTARKALHALSDPDVGILKKEKVGKCFRYHIVLFDAALAYLKENPPETIRIEYLKSKSPAVKHTTRDNSKAPITENISANQDSLKEEAPIPTGPGAAAGIAQPMPTEGEGGNKNSQKAKQPDSSLSENSSSPKPQPASQPVEIPERPQPKPQSSEPERRSKVSYSAPPPDVVPNGYIEKTIDNLTQAKTMNAASADDGIEDFVRLLKPNQAVIPYPDRQKAESLRTRITTRLADENIEMPPLLFFKHCLNRTDALIADGKLDVRPTSPNFFLIGHTGPQILEQTINQLRGENRAERDKARTNALLKEMKKRPLASEAQKQSVRDMIAKASTPEAIAAAKAARKGRK